MPLTGILDQQKPLKQAEHGAQQPPCILLRERAIPHRYAAAAAPSPRGLTSDMYILKDLA